MSNAPKSSRDHLTASATRDHLTASTARDHLTASAARDHLTASTTIKLTEQELNRVTGGATGGAGAGKAKFNEF